MRALEQLKQVTKLSDEFKRINERREARSASWTAISIVVSAVESWLRGGGVPGGCVLRDFDGPEPKLIKSESIVDGIERLRRRCREIKADIHRIQSAPYSSVNAKARMRSQVEALAEIGSPDVSDLIEHDRPVAFQMQRVQSDVVGIEATAFAFAQISDAVALTCWLHKDSIIKKLDAEIDAVADDAAALSSEEHAKRLAEAQGDLLATERDESWWDWKAQSEGLPVERRADASPAAILQCMVVAAPKHSSNGGSSPSMSFDIIGARRR